MKTNPDNEKTARTDLERKCLDPETRLTASERIETAAFMKDVKTLSDLSRRAFASEPGPALRKRIHEDAERVARASGTTSANRGILKRLAAVAAVLVLVFSFNLHKRQDQAPQVRIQQAQQEKLEQVDAILDLLTLCCRETDEDLESLEYEPIDSPPSLDSMVQRVSVLTDDDLMDYAFLE